MNEAEIMLDGHLCRVEASEQYSAIVHLQVAGSSVQLCFSKEEHPEVKQRIMRSLLDAYDQRISSPVKYWG